MPDILVSNERWKALSSLFFTLCAGLLAASGARVWEKSALDGASSAWLLLGLMLGAAGWQVLAFLVPEG